MHIQFRNESELIKLLAKVEYDPYGMDVSVSVRVFCSDEIDTLIYDINLKPYSPKAINTQITFILRWDESLKATLIKETFKP